MGIFEGCMEKTADLVRAAAMAEQIQLFSYYDKEENWLFFRRRLKQKVIVHEECMDIWIPKEKIRSFDREKS